MSEHFDYREIIFDDDDESCGEIDTDFGTCLMQAVRAGNHKMVEYLLKNGANANDMTIDDGWTVLHEATEKDSYKIVKLLLENGANPTVLDYGRNEERPADIARSKSSKIAPLLTYYYHKHFEKKDRTSPTSTQGFFNKPSKNIFSALPEEDEPAAARSAYMCCVDS